jgi:DNA-directed RNA polymerase alpha subunit
MIVTIEVEDGGPAFPSADNPGMSLRDYFAAKAMQGMLANPKLQEQILKAGQSWIEESAWAVADAMLDVRNSKSKLLSCSVTDLNLDVRAMNCLEAEGIHTIGDLCNQHTYNLTKIPNLGKITLKNIVNALAEHGLKLKS